MANFQKIKKNVKRLRSNRVRSKVRGTGAQPRLSVYRSLKHIYAQIVDDQKGVTLVSVSDFELKDEKSKSIKTELKGKSLVAFQIGELLAAKAIKKGVKEVKFDRGSSKFHGRVKALADGARQGGLEF